MLTRLTVSPPTHRTFLTAAALAQFLITPPVLAGMTECSVAFNRATNLMNQGEAFLCSNQQQMLSALDAAALACAGIKAGVDFGSLKSEFIAQARRCPSASNAQSGRDGDSRLAPSDGNRAPDRIGSDGDRADQYLKDMQKCDQVVASNARTACRYATTKAYPGSGTGSGANSNGGGGGKGGTSSSSGPDGDPDRQPKTLPSPPKDPSLDYSGKACAYFTRPALEDDARMNYYARGSCVSYGKYSYECSDDGRWLKRGPAEVFKCKTAEEAEASSGEPIKPWYIRKN